MCGPVVSIVGSPINYLSATEVLLSQDRVCETVYQIL